jgi:hypothetical protein
VSLEPLLDADGLTAAGFDEAGWFHFVEGVVETLDVGAGTSVWDAGCGAGSFLYPLSLNGYVVGGSDASAARIALARAAIPDGRFVVGPPADLQLTPPWDVVLASRGLSGCRDRGEVRELLARMVAHATHAVAVLRMVDGDAGVGRADLLRLLAEIGVSAVRFEDAGGRLHVFARLDASRS